MADENFVVDAPPPVVSAQEVIDAPAQVSTEGTLEGAIADILATLEQDDAPQGATRTPAEEFVNVEDEVVNVGDEVVNVGDEVVNAEAQPTTAEPAKIDITAEQLAEYVARATRDSMQAPVASTSVEAPRVSEEADPFDVTVEFSAEERELLNANPILMKAIEDKLAAYHKANTKKVREELDTIKQALGSQEQKATAQAFEATVAKVKTAVGSAFDEKIAHPKWTAHLQQQVPFMPQGVTFDAVMRRAVETHDTAVIIQVLNAFDVGQKAATPPNKQGKAPAIAAPPLAVSLMPQGEPVSTADTAKRAYENANTRYSSAKTEENYQARERAFTAYVNTLASL